MGNKLSKYEKGKKWVTLPFRRLSKYGKGKKWVTLVKKVGDLSK